MRHLRPSNLKVSFSGHLVIIIIVASGLIACSAPVVLSASVHRIGFACDLLGGVVQEVQLLHCTQANHLTLTSRRLGDSWVCCSQTLSLKITVIRPVGPVDKK